MAETESTTSVGKTRFTIPVNKLAARKKLRGFSLIARIRTASGRRPETPCWRCREEEERGGGGGFRRGMGLI